MLLAEARGLLAEAARCYLAAPGSDGMALAAATERFCRLAVTRGGAQPGPSPEDQELILACRRTLNLSGLPAVGRFRAQLARLVRP